MARGVGAFIMIASLVFSLTILGSLGFFASMNLDVDASTQNEDVERAANQLNSVQFGENRSPSILQGPLAVVVPFIQFLQVLTTVIGNASGLLQLLFGVPAVVADTLQTLFQIAMAVTGFFAIRGILQ